MVTVKGCKECLTELVCFPSPSPTLDSWGRLDEGWGCQEHEPSTARAERPWIAEGKAEEHEDFAEIRYAMSNSYKSLDWYKNAICFEQLGTEHRTP